MTEKKQGAAEWLRGIADKYEAEEGIGCMERAKLFGICCDEVDTCQECMTKELRVIVDRIESERALPEGIEWPRFEDGELVKIGDEVECEGDVMGVVGLFFEDRKWRIHAESIVSFGFLRGKYGERVKRPKLRVLGADGAPIEVGDTVWTTYGCSHQRVVSAVFANGSEEYGIPFGIPAVRYASGGWDRAGSVTHERPDSWRAWGEDLDMAVKSGEVDKVEMMRRAKALAKAGEQG